MNYWVAIEHLLLSCEPVRREAAYIVMAHIVMAHIVIAYIVMALSCEPVRREAADAIRSPNGGRYAATPH